MAVMQSRDTRSFIAGENLASAQFKFVTLEADGEVDLADAAGENCLGVCLVGGAAGAAVTIAITGKVLVEAGDAITAGQAIATNAAGEAVALADAGAVSTTTMGYALEDGADGQIIAIELIQGGNVSDQS
jgi:hypothetical protein